MNKSFCLSLGLHLGLLGLLHVNFKTDAVVGMPTRIAAYVYHKSTLMQRSQASLLLPLKKNGIVSSRGKKSSITSNQSSHIIAGVPNQLLLLLHDMIEAQIKHDGFFGARQNIRLAFTLFPDGHIEDVQLLVASNDAKFNVTIMQALQQIQPVTLARDFITTAQYLQLVIVID